MTLTRNLADAHGTEGIRVDLLNVGWTLTPNQWALKMKEGLPEDWPSRLPKTLAPSGGLLLLRTTSPGPRFIPFPLRRLSSTAQFSTWSNTPSFGGIRPPEEVS